MLNRFKRFLETASRTKEWGAASRDYKRKVPFCEFCRLDKTLEAHDLTPYHLLSESEKHDYSFLILNLITLCHHDHRQQAHCGDPNCLLFNTRIRDLARYVVDNRHEYCVS